MFRDHEMSEYQQQIICPTFTGSVGIYFRTKCSRAVTEYSRTNSVMINSGLYANVCYNSAHKLYHIRHCT